MKKFILVASMAAIAACSQPETPADTEATDEVVEAAPANIAADGGPSVGVYKVTQADGTTFTAEVKEDGTYAVTSDDGTVMDTGKWEQKSPELYCETSDAEGSVQVCYEEMVDENGVYLSKDPNTGMVSTVERVEAAE